MRWMILLGLLAVIAVSCARARPRPPVHAAGERVATAAAGATTATATATTTAPAKLRAVKPATDEDPVAVSMQADARPARAGGRVTISVSFDIAPRYEIHDVAAPPPAIATRLELALPPGFHSAGAWHADRKPVRSATPDGHAVYVGRVAFTRELRIDPDAEPRDHALRCAIRYQACNDRICLRPKESELSITVTTARSHR